MTDRTVANRINNQFRNPDTVRAMRRVERLRTAMERRAGVDFTQGTRATPRSGAIHINFAPIAADIQRVLGGASRKVQRLAMVRALNHESDIFYTRVKRAISAQSSVGYGKVSAALKRRKAHPWNLTYRIDARAAALGLEMFSGNIVPGKVNPKVTVWNRRQTFEGAFGVRLADGKVVAMKRVAPRTGYERRDGKVVRSGGAVQKLYGPIVSREMIRTDGESLRIISVQLPQRIIPRLQHELRFIMAQSVRR